MSKSEYTYYRAIVPTQFADHLALVRKDANGKCEKQVYLGSRHTMYKWVVNDIPGMLMTPITQIDAKWFMGYANEMKGDNNETS